MRISGKITFPDNLERSPHLLLQIVKEIDKVCPEEETPGTSMETPHNVSDNDNQNSSCVVVLLPQLGIHGEGPSYCGLTFALRLRLRGIHRRRRRSRTSLRKTYSFLH
jgi:hypothetical protein